MIFLVIFAIITPSKYIEFAFQGILLWAKNVLPSLFPFFVFTKIIIELDLLKPLTKITYPISKKLFKTNKESSNLFLISIISGYPVSSKLIIEAYKTGKISYDELIKLNAYTSMSGPLFIIGTLGINLLNNKLFGYILYLGQLIGSILNGLIYRNYKSKHKTKETINKDIKPIRQNILTSAISTSITSILQIGGLICIFYISLNALNGIINLPPILNGIIELTNGCNLIANTTNNHLILLLSFSVLLSFGGLCIHAQCMDYLSQAHFPYKTYIIQKLTQVLTSTLSTCFIYNLILFFNFN